MGYALATVLVGLLLGACAAAPAANRPATQPTSQATSQPTTQPALKSTDVHYGIYLARLDVHTTISPGGLLRRERTENKSYGPNDIDPKNERIEIRQGRLTREQMASLAALFAGWDSLSDKPYPGVPDGGDVKIRYGDKTVSGGSSVPEQVRAVHARIDELAETMPVVGG